MAGYTFTLDNINSLNEIIVNQVYSTNLNNPLSNKWLTHHEGTFTEYLLMTEGDKFTFL
jgi:hypothetical protein